VLAPFFYAGCRARAVPSPSLPRWIWVSGHLMVANVLIIRAIDSCGALSDLWAFFDPWSARIYCGAIPRWGGQSVISVRPLRSIH
jgi:hypothetical protein